MADLIVPIRVGRVQGARRFDGAGPKPLRAAKGHYQGETRIAGGGPGRPPR